MTYEIAYRDSAAKTLGALPADIQTRVHELMDEVAKDPLGTSAQIAGTLRQVVSKDGICLTFSLIDEQAVHLMMVIVLHVGGYTPTLAGRDWLVSE